MRAYQYSYKKRKKRRSVVPAAVFCAALAAFLLGEQGRNISALGREMQVVGYEEILSFSVPGMTSEDGAGGIELVAEQLLSHFFLLAEVTGEQNYTTQIESDLSYEAILEREAADESYVDADTGEVVIAGGIFGDEKLLEDGLTGENGTGHTGEQVEEEAAAEEAADGVEADSTGLLAGITGGDKVVTYPREKLNDYDYLIQNFYQVDRTTTIGGNQLNADALLGKDMRLSHGPDTPQILIYHTHSQEGYADSVQGDAAGSVVGVGDYLTKLLTERYGMNVIHHTEAYDVEDRDHAYSRAGPGVEQILRENPGIEVVIDLHRDGVAADKKLVTDVGGVKMAQIMFFNGLSRITSMGDIAYLNNPYIADNLALSFQMQLKAAEYYPGFTRRIYLKGYRYNMHYCPRTLLVEVGAQTNTVQEAMNAMVPLADLLNKVLTGPQ